MIIRHMACVLTGSVSQRLEAAELKMFYLGTIRMDRIRNENIKRTTRSILFWDKAREVRLKWYGGGTAIESKRFVDSFNEDMKLYCQGSSNPLLMLKCRNLLRFCFSAQMFISWLSSHFQGWRWRSWHAHLTSIHCHKRTSLNSSLCAPAEASTSFFPSDPELLSGVISTHLLALHGHHNVNLNTSFTSHNYNTSLLHSLKKINSLIIDPRRSKFRQLMASHKRINLWFSASVMRSQPLFAEGWRVNSVRGHRTICPADCLVKHHLSTFQNLSRPFICLLQ